MPGQYSSLHSIADRDGATILDIQRGVISTLNPTGAYIWQELTRDQAVDDIIVNLCRESGEPRSAVERDVREFIASLKANHLLGR